MPNILDYIKNHGEKTFSDLMLNSIDIAIINELGYLPLGEQLHLTQPVTLQALKEDFQASGKKVHYSFTVTKQRVELLKAVLAAPRYQGLSLVSYINDIDPQFEKQFAAMVLSLPNINHYQVIFRGTDETLIGWKEDFKMTYASEIPAQRQALAYLIKILEASDCRYTVTGHSKGGNLALYAAANLPEDFQARIDQLFIFDAPGLHNRVLHSQGYQAIRDKVLCLRPKDSIVGSMLKNDLASCFIESKAIGTFQHDVATWEVNGTDWQFASGPSELSQALEETFSQWTQELSKQELKILFDTVFDLFLENDVATLDDFQADILKSAKTIMTAFSQLPADKRQLLNKSALSLLSIFVKSRFEQLNFPNPKQLSEKWRNLLGEREER
ncbi:Mbeg1-like protein [Streptococcus tangpeifui]|uniref:Mbeg1-like protein n=1 Tax=Streptococcus tangpeifui TaxID=2709400 RepID=UPI0013EAD358|nr:Mbeg1-like protein [Streptococcus sp. ZJ1593]